jgi:hypothetical protein
LNDEILKCKKKLEESESKYHDLHRKTEKLISGYKQITQNVLRIQFKDVLTPKIKKDLSDMRNIFFKKLIKFMVFAEEADKNSKPILKAELELKSKLLTKSLKAADVYKKIIDRSHGKDDTATEKMNSLITIVGAECLFFGEILLTEKFSNRTTGIFTTAPSQGTNLCEIRNVTGYKNLKKTKYYLVVTNDGDLRFYTYADDLRNNSV